MNLSPHLHHQLIETKTSFCLSFSGNTLYTSFVTGNRVRGKIDKGKRVKANRLDSWAIVAKFSQ